MLVIQIPEFEFDSLINWKDPYDVKMVYPGLTMQECRLASNFHSFNKLDAKASSLLQIVQSMNDSSRLEDEQLLFITELINFNAPIRDTLIRLFNSKAKTHHVDVRLEMVSENE